MLISSKKGDSEAHNGHLVGWDEPGKSALTSQVMTFDNSLTLTIANTTTTYIFILDANGRCIYLNRAAKEKTGYQCEDVQGKNLHELHHHHHPSGEEFHIEDCPIYQALNNQRPLVNYEGDFIRKNGSFFHALVNAQPIFESGNFLGTVIEFKDLSERDQGELRAHFIAEAMPEKIWTTTAQGELDYCNAHFLNYSGFSWEELQGWGWTQMLHPDDVEATRTDWENAVQLGKEFHIEHRLKRFDGSYYWHLSQAIPMKDEQGRIAIWVGTSTDIHRLKETEAHLLRISQWEEQTREILYTLQQASSLQELFSKLCTRTARLLQANRCYVIQFKDQFGAQTEQEKSNQVGLTSVVDPSTLESLPIQYEYTSPGTTSFLGEVPPWKVCLFLRETASLKSVFVTNTQQSDLLDAEWKQIFNSIQAIGFAALPIHFKGQLLSVLVLHTATPRTWREEEQFFLRNTAELVSATIYHMEANEEIINSLRRESETRRKLEQSNKELEEFATVASHDLQEPLRKVLLFSDHLKNTCQDILPEEALDDIFRLQRAASKMQNLIMDLLDLSRVTRKGQPFRKVNLNDILQEVCHELYFLIRDTNATVEAEPLPTIDADPNQIRQLFYSIIENGIKFHKQDVPPVIKVFPKTMGPNECEIVVKDNGIGFDESYKERIFEIFQRLHGKMDYPGTGIGLTLARKIVERHKGAISANSKLGEGSTFIIKLPCLQD